jgi:hypothetical protein
LRGLVPTDAIKPDGEFDFFACYNHLPRFDPGFLDLVRIWAGKPRLQALDRPKSRRCGSRWRSRSVPLLQLCGHVPGGDHGAFRRQGGAAGLSAEHAQAPPHTRREVDERSSSTRLRRATRWAFPGEWRTPADTTRPTAAAPGSCSSPHSPSNVDSMMRNLPHYFRPSEATALAFTCQMELTGEGGGEWVITVGDERCRVRPGRVDGADLVVRCDARLFLRVHRGEASAPWHLASIGCGKRRCSYLPRLFRRHGESWLHRVAWRAPVVANRGVLGGDDPKPRCAAGRQDRRRRAAVLEAATRSRRGYAGRGWRHRPPGGCGGRVYHLFDSSRAADGRRRRVRRRPRACGVRRWTVGAPARGGGRDGRRIFGT